MNAQSAIAAMRCFDPNWVDPADRATIVLDQPHPISTKLHLDRAFGIGAGRSILWVQYFTVHLFQKIT